MEQQITTQPSLDGPGEARFTDPEVKHLYISGLLSRAEADVFDLIVTLNDQEEGSRVHV